MCNIIIGEFVISKVLLQIDERYKKLYNIVCLKFSIIKTNIIIFRRSEVSSNLRLQLRGIIEVPRILMAIDA